MRTALVVPCFNEADRLDGEAFCARLDLDPALDLVFVDDGSSDRTAELLDELQRRQPARIEVLRLARNQGKAEAVRFGVRHALRADPGYVGYWDADLATPLDEVDEMRALFDAHPGALLVMGSRVKLLGRTVERRAVRHYLGRIFATFASLALGMGVYDTQCGAKIFRVTDTTRLLFDQPFLTRWIFDVELLARLRSALGRDPSPCVIEYPLRQWHDIQGSKVRSADFLTAALELARIAWRYRGSTRPPP